MRYTKREAVKGRVWSYCSAVIYSVNWPHNVYYSSPGHDDTHKNRSKAYNLSSTLLVHSLQTHRAEFKVRTTSARKTNS